MDTLIKSLIGLSAVAFLLAVAGTVFGLGTILGTQPEGFSRACSNLTLLAIAMSVSLKGRSATP